MYLPFKVFFGRTQTVFHRNNLQTERKTDLHACIMVYLSRMGLINNCTENKAVPTVNILKAVAIQSRVHQHIK